MRFGTLHRAPASGDFQKGQAGMTLLEVLAAFMIFSLVFTVLVGSSQKAVQTQGTSFRQLEADELADASLADLEAALSRQKLPEIESEQIDRDPFLVRVREVPFGGEDADGLEAGGTGAVSGSADLDVMSLLAAEMPELAPFFKQYDVEVEWQEGNRPKTVQRTALGFDWQGASQVFAALLPQGANAPGTDPASGPEGENGDGADGSGGSGRDGDRGGRDGRGRGSQSELERLKEQFRRIEAEAAGQGR